ncbi:MAG: conjugal transfer protein TraN [Alphaproteobacteria bacterium]|nr:conjugal transfer protein TraN [Alphaproteobacteria bacterium]
MKKRIFKLFCFSLPLLFLFAVICIANPTTNLKSGDQTAQEFLNQMEKKKKEAGNHPFYSGHSCAANLKSTQLVGAAQNLSNTDPASQMIHKSAESRPQVKINPSKDPLITGSQKILENPLKTIGGEGTHVIEIKQDGKDEILTCEEPGDDSLESCLSQLVVKVRKFKVRKEWKGQIRFWMNAGKKKWMHLACGALRHDTRRAYQTAGNITAAYKACMQELGNKSSGSYVTLSPLGIAADKIKEVKVDSILIQRRRGLPRQRFQVNCSGLTYNHEWHRKSWYDCQPLITIVYEEDSYEILPDEWASNCQKLEERVDQGLCHYASKECTQGKQTRSIEGIPITRDCWQEKLTYACAYPAKDNCDPLRARGCAQINSACKQKVGNVCVVYTQTYQCKGATKTTHQITGGNTPFCMDGSCRDQSFEANNEMMSSLAQLSLLKNMQGKMNSIFKGDSHQCSKYILSFKDCCGSGKGWGKSIGLGGCSENEKLLQKKRQVRLCHYVGTYCAKKILGKCVKKKSAFCCFGSKLLKAFQEQGRQQIGLGWGSPKEPLCRGFTIQEIQRIDFSKLDLREAFEDLMKNYSPQKLQGTGQKIGERLETIKQGIIPHAKQQPKQRPEA